MTKSLLRLAGASLALALPLAHAAAADPVTITIRDSGCEPMKLTVPAGKTTFLVDNASGRVIEWEILSGVEIVAERENILPGFKQSVTATLAPGRYEMTCGLRRNPKGTLEAAGPAGAAPTATDKVLAEPIARYKAYVAAEADDFGARTKAFVAAVKAGRVAEAKALYAVARQPYERIEPIAELFGELDAAIDAREDDFERHAEDPAFVGFHRLEKALFVDGKTDGVVPVAERLEGDVAALREKVAGLALTPRVMVGGAAELIEEVAAKKISGEEERYSRTDLSDLAANVEGARRIVDLLGPHLATRDAALVQRIGDNFAAIDAVMVRYRDGAAYQPYDRLNETDRLRLKGPVTALAEDLAKLRGLLGVD